MYASTATTLAPPRRAVLASAVSLAAGLIHAAAAVPHFGDDTLLGTGFMLVGWAQIVVAALLLRRVGSRRTAATAIVIHVGALVGLGVSRTVGLPVGHGGVEPMAFPDGITAALELSAVFVLLWWLARPTMPVRRRLAAGAGVTAVWLMALSGSTLAVANLGTSGHGHDQPAMAAGTADHHADGAPAHEDDDPTSGAADPVHVHDDSSIHVHLAAAAHPHDDGTVHAHVDEADQRDGSAVDRPEGREEGHTHAPGEGHA